MGPKRLTREEKKAETRSRLLDAAARVFAREGFHGASVEQIAEEAGYSHGAVYSNFSGKEDLFIALSEEYALARTRETAESFVGAGDFGKQVRSAADVWMERLRRDPETFILRLEFALHAARSPEVRDAFATRSGAIRLLIERILHEHAEAASVDYPLPADELALIVRALGIGLAVERLLDPDIGRDELFGDFVAMLVDLMEGRSPQAARGKPATRRRPARTKSR